MDKVFLSPRAVICHPTRSCRGPRSCTDGSPQLRCSWVGWFQFGLYQARSSLWFILNYKWNKIRPIKNAQDIPTPVGNSFSKNFSAGTQSWVKSAQWGKALKPLPVGPVLFVSSLPHLPWDRLGKGFTEQENVKGTDPLGLAAAAGQPEHLPPRLTVPPAAVCCLAGSFLWTPSWELWSCDSVLLLGPTLVSLLCLH